MSTIEITKPTRKENKPTLNRSTKNEIKTTSTINMRIDAKRRTLIEEAAKYSHKDRTSFILDAALKAAEEAILDRRVFVLNDKDFDDFDRALSQNKLENNLCIQKALKSKRRWTK